MHSCPLLSPFGLKSFLYFQRKKFLSGPILKIPLMWNPCCVKQKKKKSLTVEEVFFPADCKCSFLCCFLNDLGNFRNHKTINTYIHFFCFVLAPCVNFGKNSFFLSLDPQDLPYSSSRKQSYFLNVWLARSVNIRESKQEDPSALYNPDILER